MTQSTTKSWPIFCLIVSGIFFVRGILLMSVLPPLEGWDEYQHIACIVFIAENGRMPVLNQDFVPESMYPDLVDNPHSDCDIKQTGHIGCLSYRDFFSTGYRETGSGKILLYQAQHPPLYYMAFYRLYRMARQNLGFRQTITVFRMINLFLAAIGIFFFLLPIRKLFVSPAAARLAALAIGVAPITLIYILRVSNDASAFLLAGLMFFLLSTLETGEKFIMKSAALAILIASGVWIKLTVFMYLPVTGIYLLYTTIFNDIPLRKILSAVLLIGLLYAGIAGTYHRQTLTEYGTPLLSQEAVKNIANGESFRDTINRIEFSHLKSFLINRMLRGSLWRSGWSFLGTLNPFVNFYMCLLLLGFTGMFPLICVRFRNRRQFSPEMIHTWVLAGIVSVMAFSAAYFHALNSIAAHGKILTPAYYLAPGYPVFIAWILASYQGYRNRFIGRFGSIALILIFTITEIYSVAFIAMPHWTGSQNFTEIISRTAAVHTLFPGPFLLVPVMGIYLVMLVMAVSAIRRSG